MTVILSIPSYCPSLPMTDYDSPWKEMLENYFPAFMAFFFPEADQETKTRLGGRVQLQPELEGLRD